MTPLVRGIAGWESVMHGFRSVFLLSFIASTVALRAQMPLIPFHKIERDSQARLDDTSDLSAASSSGSSSSSSAIPAAAVVTMPRPRLDIPPVADRTYFLLNGLHLGMAMFDIGLTQHCIAEHRCVEGNPLMPSSMPGQLGVTLGLFTYGAVGSYYLKKHRSRAWSALPLSGMSTHTIGVISGLRASK